jgi:hypothetical protein
LLRQKKRPFLRRLKRALDAKRGYTLQFRLIPAFLVFLGSYLPLAIILALQDVTEESWELGLCKDWEHCVLPSSNHPYLSLLVIAVTLLCLLLTIKILSGIRYKYPITIIESKPIPSELISYSFPYIVSFIGVDYGATGKIAGLAVFLVWLFLITYRAGQIIMNPILLVLGWNLYEAKASINGHERIIKILSKTSLTPGAYLCQEVQGNYICKEGRQE